MYPTSYPILVAPLVKQSQKVVKKPMLTFEYVDRKNHSRIDQLMRQMYLLGMHGDGYLRDTQRDWWVAGDTVNQSGMWGKYSLLVCRANGAIVGLIQLEDSESTIDTYVIPTWRKRGIASAMVKALRSHVGDKRVLCGWPGMKGMGWEAYYAKNFICCVEVHASAEDIVKYDNSRLKAEAALIKSAKLRTAAAYRKSLK